MGHCYSANDYILMSNKSIFPGTLEQADLELRGLPPAPAPAPALSLKLCAVPGSLAGTAQLEREAVFSFLSRFPGM